MRVTSKTERTVTRAFRINEAAFNTLQEDAEKHNVSTNTLVNQLFLRYANYDRFFENRSWASTVQLPTPILRQIFQAVPEEKLIEIGKWTGNGLSARDLVLAMKGEFSLESIIDFVKDYAHRNSWAYNYVVQGDRRTITVTHNLGRGFSLLGGYIFKTNLESVGAWPKLSVDENAVAIELVGWSSSSQEEGNASWR